MDPLMTAPPTAETAKEAFPALEPDDGRPRLDSVDMLRGLVMVLMLLDHVRDFFTDFRLDPTDLSRTNAALFLTRWATHFCAPVFIFLAGTGAFLAAARGKTRPQLSRFLLTRGLWLIVLEVTLVRWGMTFHPAPRMIFALVIWAIGCSMIALSALVFLPTRWVGAFGVAMIAAHNLLDGVSGADLGRLRPLWLVLHEEGMIRLPDGLVVFVGYPLVPWIGVMAAGYAFGELLLREPERRRRTLLLLGLGLTAAFVVLRTVNVYGDPRPWSAQGSPLFTALSFLNCTKYPPSLLYLLMTLGPAIAALALFDRSPGSLGRPLVTLGRVPLFFYLLQWPVAHGLAVAVAAARGQPLGWLFPSDSPPIPAPGSIYGLPVVYLMWVVALLTLYPACRLFADLKRRRKDAWLSYL